MRPPAQGYLRRLPFFRHYDAEEVDDLLRRASFERVDPRALLVAEGERPRALFVTVNGAVEKVLVRGERRIRVGLAGPGRAFGYVSSSTVAHLPSPRSRGSG